MKRNAWTGVVSWPWVEGKHSSKYYANITCADRNIGRVLQALDELGIDDNTLVIFIGDNGYCIGQHGLHGKGNATFLHYDEEGRLGGIAIDGCYRIIGNDGRSNPRIFDIAFPHATGVRPYSYGLQACNATAGIVVDALYRDLMSPKQKASQPEMVTKAYNDLPKTA